MLFHPAPPKADLHLSKSQKKQIDKLDRPLHSPQDIDSLLTEVQTTITSNSFYKTRATASHVVFLKLCVDDVTQTP